MVYDASLSAIRYACIIAQMFEPKKWSVDRIKEIMTTPWALHDTEAPGVFYREQIADIDTIQKNPIVRRLDIRQDDLTAHGYTQDCPKCQHIIAQGPGMSPNMQHTAQCRARITEAIAGTQEGEARLQKLTEREDRYLADHRRQHAEDGTAQAQLGIDGPDGPDAPEAVLPPSDFIPASPLGPQNFELNQKLHDHKQTSWCLCQRI